MRRRTSVLMLVIAPILLALAACDVPPVVSTDSLATVQPAVHATDVCLRPLSGSTQTLRSVRYGGHNGFDRLAFDFCSPTQFIAILVSRSSATAYTVTLTPAYPDGRTKRL